MKRKLIALAADRKACLDAAENALNSNDQATFDSKMEELKNIDGQIKDVKALIAAQETVIDTDRMSAGEVSDMMADRGEKILNHERVKITTGEILKGLRNAVTIGGTLVQPTGAGSEIHGGEDAISSILDLVQVEDYTGLSGYEEPYVVSEFDGTAGGIGTNSGQARTASDDPTFGIAQIKPVEVTTTSYVDRNIAKLSPANYYAKVQRMALRALRRKAAALIVNGYSVSSDVTYGIKTAVNKAGSAICAADTYSAIDVNTLDDLYFAYGADSEMGGQAALFLKKGDLKTIGQLRGTNEKRRLFTITPQGNGNRGVIADGGVQIPYVLTPPLSDGDLIYGNPLHYILGLFGDYEIRVDESVKSVERLHTILGDVALGGNVVWHHGFVYYSKALSQG